MKILHKPKLDPRLMTHTELIAYVHELEAENARLEEGYQKSLGVIAATDCVECKRDKASKCDVCEFNRGFATWESVKKGFECTNCKCVSENSSSFCQYCGAMMVVSG